MYKVHQTISMKAA